MMQRRRLTVSYCLKLLGDREQVPVVLWDSLTNQFFSGHVQHLQGVYGVEILEILDYAGQRVACVGRISHRFYVPLKAELLLGA